jgi:hypothetical protein
MRKTNKKADKLWAEIIEETSIVLNSDKKDIWDYAKKAEKEVKSWPKSRQTTLDLNIKKEPS